MVQDELSELLEAALYREIASQAFYEAGQQRTDDPGAIALMKELAEEELHHIEYLRSLKEKDWTSRKYDRKAVTDLGISDYLTGSDKLDGAGLQDTLIFAMKREQHALEFYSKMANALRSERAKTLCEKLVQEELKHKHKLEAFYDDLFYGED